MDRRDFIHCTGAAAISSAFSSTLAPQARAAEPVPSGKANPRGKADHCIVLWLSGGMAQIDTFDPKPTIGDATAKKPGAYYPSINTAVPGVRVCEHLPRTAKLMEHVTAIRSVHHDVIDEHSAADNRMHTGRRTSGTIQYPSLGSIIAHERGAADDKAPANVLIGYPSTSRGPGFLGAKHGYLYLTDTTSGPRGLARPAWLSDERTARRETLLDAARRRQRTTFPNDTLLADTDAAIAEARGLSGPAFMKTFDLSQEKDSLRNAYGGEFGQRVLLARRLVERGTRFVEVAHNLNFTNGTGWDTHNQGQLKQHLLIQELDQAFAALITDLKARKMLDRTLIFIGTEFGRPAAFDSGGGRGHHGKAFSVVLAGGGLRHCGAFGVTDHLAQRVVASPVGVPDLFASVLDAMKVDPAKMLQAGDRPVPITDYGKPILKLS